MVFQPLFQVARLAHVVLRVSIRTVEMQQIDDQAFAPQFSQNFCVLVNSFLHWQQKRSATTTNLAPHLKQNLAPNITYGCPFGQAFAMTTPHRLKPKLKSAAVSFVTARNRVLAEPPPQRANFLITKPPRDFAFRSAAARVENAPCMHSPDGKQTCRFVFFFFDFGFLVIS